MQVAGCTALPTAHPSGDVSWVPACAGMTVREGATGPDCYQTAWKLGYGLAALGLTRPMVLV
jgi:hypothetical protein